MNQPGCLHELVPVTKLIHSLRGERRWRCALRGKTGTLEKEKQGVICSPVWPQGVRVSSSRKKLPKTRGEGAVLLQTHEVPGPQAVRLRSPGEEADKVGGGDTLPILPGKPLWQYWKGFKLKNVTESVRVSLQKLRLWHNSTEPRAWACVTKSWSIRLRLLSSPNQKHLCSRPYRFRTCNHLWSRPVLHKY